MIKSKISQFALDNKTVFLRADANVPLDGTHILSDFRLQAIRPTIDLLLEKKSTILFATHIGRPQKPTPSLSTKILMPWFEHHGYKVIFARTIEEAHRVISTRTAPIIILENLRFFEGEQKHDITFARQLASLADFYVTDAFATLHRKDSSIVLVPTFFPLYKKTIGLLIEKEIYNLTHLLERPRKGFTLLLGGGKVSTKIPLLKALVDKVETIILCPAIVFSFLKAIGKPVGSSLVDDSVLTLCKDIIKTADRSGTKIIYPSDYQISKAKLSNTIKITSNDHIPDGYVGTSIGAHTVDHIQEIIKKSTTVFYNGLMGSMLYPNTLAPLELIFASIANSACYSVITGGDSIALLEKINAAQDISYLSTGGGATLDFLSGIPLAGIIALSE